MTKVRTPTPFIGHECLTYEFGFDLRVGVRVLLLQDLNLHFEGFLRGMPFDGLR